ncbi:MULTISPECIES: hypothetical protein [Novosphingobium]|jgi:hypothetical protein|uniref:hypothetical protein n=1 Tax=Novosphingobium TaxID=165696 RepID=UPI0022F279D9|nr:hypothetical protein [Novosphingobium resinovorum]GLK42535.1 hypothetical protein GCM10017612_04520 [Novosphingobium resinovorum]
MTKDDLAERLALEGIAPSAYDLSGAGRSESYVFREQSSDWAVFYSERGLQTGLRVFATETEACGYFIQLVASDPTTRAALD